MVLTTNLVGGCSAVPAYNAADADPGGPSGASDKILRATRDEILGRYERWLSATDGTATNA